MWTLPGTESLFWKHGYLDKNESVKKQSAPLDRL